VDDVFIDLVGDHHVLRAVIDDVLGDKFHFGWGEYFAGGIERRVEYASPPSPSPPHCTPPPTNLI